jgi:hypothetical protein
MEAQYLDEFTHVGGCEQAALVRGSVLRFVLCSGMPDAPSVSGKRDEEEISTGHERLLRILPKA